MHRAGISVGQGWLAPSSIDAIPARFPVCNRFLSDRDCYPGLNQDHIATLPACLGVSRWQHLALPLLRALTLLLLRSLTLPARLELTHPVRWLPGVGAPSFPPATAPAAPRSSARTLPPSDTVSG